MIHCKLYTAWKVDYLAVVGLNAADKEGVGHLQALHEGHEGHVKLSADRL